MRIEQKLSIPLVLVAAGNSIKGIIRNDNLFYYIFYCFIFIAIAILIQFIKIKKSEMRLSLLLLIMSLIALWLDDIRSLFGIMLLTYSIILSNKNVKTYWIYGSLAAITIIFRFAFYSFSATDLTTYLSGSAFVVIIYHHYIHPKISNISKPGITLESYYSQEVNNDVVDILQNRCVGLDWPEINAKLELCINDSELPRKIRKERKRLGFKNQDQFNLWLFQNGIIKPKTDKVNMRS